MKHIKYKLSQINSAAAEIEYLNKKENEEIKKLSYDIQACVYQILEDLKDFKNK
jgi:hypothetical protein